MAKSAAQSFKLPRKARAGKTATEQEALSASAIGDGNAHASPRQQNAVSAEKTGQPLFCGLYLVSTPIGNLEDITLRAIRVLGQADAIACEDTRVTGKLLKHLGIKKPMIIYNDHNGARIRPKLLSDLRRGKSVALVSDAGTPLISDPGFKLVRACIEKKINIFPIPGASAFLAGLVVSGLPTDQVMFVGFLPQKQSARRSALLKLTTISATLVFYESGRRLAKSLADMHNILGPRPVSIGRELTKKYEQVIRGSLPQIAANYASAPTPKGELVVVVGPSGDMKENMTINIDGALRKALQTRSVRDAATEVAAITGLPRRKLYAEALRINQEMDCEP
ncbi:MAG: 16S rRNA (cytidine(1402)-2'-O)-methyltransferase [Rhodospirillaceae bacterium]